MQAYSPLLTDFYQLTMAYGYWRLGMHDKLACFHLLFRKNPFKSNYAICCGLETVLNHLLSWEFKQGDLDYLSTLKNSKGRLIFSHEFLDFLRDMKMTCDVFAIPEGTVVFGNEPLIRVQGPIIQCQLIETALLNIINFQTLIATKATRVCRAASGDPVIEFGMRRAQGPDGALSASRAAFIGGCMATSNTLAGKEYGIPVRGTHAHSWVTAFNNELEAFQAYASILPEDCVLLVDTFNTLEGVQHAIKIGNDLKNISEELTAIRLDSGNMAELSIKARKLLDDAGFKSTAIMASNSLDEYAITSLKQASAKISIWGVGTNLATAYDQPALDGVYKLSAFCQTENKWDYKLKLSEQNVKISNPGRHQVRRFFCNETYFADVLYDLDLGISDSPTAIALDKHSSPIRLDDVDGFVDLLLPVLKNGERIQKPEPIQQLQKRATESVAHFIKTNGEKNYTIALEENLFQLKKELIDKYRV